MAFNIVVLLLQKQARLMPLLGQGAGLQLPATAPHAGATAPVTPNLTAAWSGDNLAGAQQAVAGNATAAVGTTTGNNFTGQVIGSCSCC